VPGLNPKPPPEIYRPQLRRVLRAGIERARPRAAEWFALNDAFDLIAWTYLFYGAHRDISVDLPGIERLLVQAEPSEEDRKELASWPRRLKRWTHIVGDAFPFVGRRLAQPATRRLMHEASRYLKNRDGKGDEIRAILRSALDQAFDAGEAILLIGHSLGSVIAYDTLYEISRSRPERARVDLFMTLGSPLATHFVQRSLHGAHASGADRYPRNIRRWVNLTARGDTTALQRRLKPTFREMLDLGLVESIEDFVDFDNYFRGELGLNAHEAYGYLAQRLLGEIVGAWIEQYIPDDV